MKKEYATLPNAPIKEAIIQVVVPDRNEINSEGFADFINPQFPHLDRVEGIEFGVSAGPDGFGTHQRQRFQDRFLSDNKTKAVQFSHNFLCLSHLAPYQCWNDFVDEYMELWERFVQDYSIEKVGPTLRFINEFDLPSASLNKELRIGGNIDVTDSENDISVQRVFSQFDLAKDNLLGEVIFQVSSRKQDEVIVIFDIQTQLADLVEYADTTNLRSILERLREFKNEIFFSNVPRAKEIFS